MLQASLARILGLIVGLAIMGGVSHSPEQTPTGELPITVTAAAVTPNNCDPDTTCEGLEADVEFTECWVEHKVDLPDELIQGDPKLMPAGSTVVPCTTPAATTPAHEPWQMTSTCEHNTAGGFGGWVCTQDGIPADHECVVHISAQPYRAIVVPDNSVLCDVDATGYIQASPQDNAATPAIPGGAVCGTDYECEQLSGENYGYNWTGHDGQRGGQA